MMPLCAPLICQTKESCPWLNAATAGGFLEGTVTTTVTHSKKNQDDATCEFILRQGSVVSGLRIDVETMSDPASAFSSYEAQCGPKADSLRAIGNEAVVCSLPAKKKQVSEQIVGRVRDRAFLVRISSNASPPARNELREKAEKIAEQVAGFLF